MFSYTLGEGAELRILEVRHASEFLAFVETNRDYLGAWLEWAHTMNTLEQAENFIQRGLKRYIEDGLPWVGIWLEQRLVGGILFFPVEKNIQATMIGYWLGQKAAGRGLMNKAVTAMLHFVFTELKLNRVELQAHVDNTRSRAAAERLGFLFEGIQRDIWKHKGEFVDHAVYAMLARDWSNTSVR